MAWYYVENGQRIGPISDEAFEQAVREETVRSETLVWKEGMEEWASLATVRPPAAASVSPADAPASPAAASVPPAADPVSPAAASGEAAEADRPQEAAAAEHSCSLCGEPYPPEALIRYRDNLICWACKPVFIQRLREGAGRPGESAGAPAALESADFWPRAGAKIIDVVLLGVASYLAGLVWGLLVPASQGPRPFGPLSAIPPPSLYIYVVIGALYNTWLIGKYGATPGKRTLGIRVVTSGGGPVGYPRALGRHGAEWISTLILSIGYSMAAFDDRSRALHDRLCDTWVVRQ